MKKHIKKSYLSTKLATMSKELAPTEVPLAPIEIILAPAGTGSEEPPLTGTMTLFAVSSSESNQPLQLRKRFRHLRHGYEPSSSQPLVNPSPPPGPLASPSNLPTPLALASPLASSATQEPSSAPSSTPPLPQELEIHVVPPSLQASQLYSPRRSYPKWKWHI